MLENNVHRSREDYIDDAVFVRKLLLRVTPDPVKAELDAYHKLLHQVRKLRRLNSGLAADKSRETQQHLAALQERATVEVILAFLLNPLTNL